MKHIVTRALSPLRSVLYVPAINVKAVSKSRALDTDAIILDLEDAVAPSSKMAARNLLVEHFSGSWGHRSVAVRVNGRGTQWYADDLRMAAQVDCAAVVLPKVESFEEVLDAAHILRSVNPTRQVPLWAMVETPCGVLNVAEIAKAGAESNSNQLGPHLECLVAGTSDLTTALGARHELGRQPLLSALSAIVLAARAYDLRALDGVCLQLPTSTGSTTDTSAADFQAECAQGRSLGFHGKTLIHPSQIKGANMAYGPSASDITSAARIVEAFESGLARGDGVVVVDGRLIEILHYNEAKAVLEFARLLEDRSMVGL